MWTMQRGRLESRVLCMWMMQRTAINGDVVQLPTHSHTFFRCRVSILFLAADGDTGVKHDRVRIEHVLRQRLELEGSAGLDTRVPDQCRGGGPEFQALRDIDPAVVEQPLDLRTLQVSCNNTTHTHACRRMGSMRRHIAWLLHNDLRM